MNQEIKAKWIADLRSGKFPQTRGALNQLEASTVGDPPVGFCCLGVLCEQAVSAGLIAKREMSIFADYGPHSSVSSLPVMVRTWAGIDSATENTLIDMNDGARSSFAEIADWIEANL